MEQKDTSTTILILPSHHFAHDTNAHRRKIQLQQAIGLAKIFGLVERKQKDLVQRRRQGDKMGCGCKNNMSNKYGGTMYGKKTSRKVNKKEAKAYSTIKVRKGGMKKPSAKGFRGYSYREY
tara:strand:+ start:619 stop:981 length:363 start_codon:yes stop_codon:yes gene_type:complete